MSTGCEALQVDQSLQENLDVNFLRRFVSELLQGPKHNAILSFLTRRQTLGYICL